MELVSFITTESGDDLIVSFAVIDQNDPHQIESLIILRTPKFEKYLEEWERCAAVSFERDADDIHDGLLEVAYSQKDQHLRMITQLKTYDLDLRKVDLGEISAMRKVFRKMNFDESIKLSGI